MSDLLRRGSDRAIEGDPVRKFLVSLVRHVGGGILPTARTIGLHERTIRGLIEDVDRKPTFSTVLCLAAAVQQPVETILSFPEEAAAQGQLSFVAPDVRQSGRPRLSAVRHSELEAALNSAAYGSSMQVIPSVAAICRAHSVSLGCVQQAFPMLVSRIVSRRHALSVDRSGKVRARAASVVRDALSTVSQDELGTISRKKLTLQLMRASGLPKRALADAAKVALAITSREIVEKGNTLVQGKDGSCG